MASQEEKTLRRELGRLRVFAFVAVFIVVGLAGQLNEESDIFLHALDEYALIGLSIVVIILVVAWRKKQGIADLKKQLNIYEVLFVIMLIFKIFAIFQEIGDPSDFGNEPPILILLILTLLSRFV
jgi:uncharacterized membrane protein